MLARRPIIKGLLGRIRSSWKKAGEDQAYCRNITLDQIKQHTIINDMVCGWHSGFKPCCILFYLIWARIGDRIHYFVSHMGILRGFEYIPCPLCFIMNQRHLKAIKCKCCPCPNNEHYDWCRHRIKDET
jgi:hypothetical protein